LFLISLAGIPPLAGFIGKLFIFKAAIDRGGIGVWLAVVMVINSVISVVYYVGVVRPMYFEDVEEPVRPLRLPALVTAVVGAAAVTILVVGILPDLFARFPRLSTLLGP
jgi:NADH-quinone oxidoreductase subunit N